MDLHVVEIIGALVIAAVTALNALPREEAPEPVPVRVDDDPSN